MWKIVDIIVVALLVFCGETKKVDVTHTFFDSPISDIQWLTKNATTVLVLTTGGRVWRSRDAGRAFEDLTPQLAREAKNAENDTTLLPFESLVVHSEDSNFGLILSKKTAHFFTADGGVTWKKLGVNTKVYNWVWHPFRPQHALFSRWSDGCTAIVKDKATAKNDCNHVLYVTKDLGNSYHRVTNYVVQYSWGPKTTAATADPIYFTAHTSLKAGGQPRHAGWHDTVDFITTYNQGASYKVIVKGGNKFLVTKDYMFCAQVDDIVRQTVNLLVSTDGGNIFTKVRIPTLLRDKSYTILDTSQGGVVIHVNHGSRHDGTLEGNVYVSDGTGTRFSLSLPNNIRSPGGECEFDRVMGVDGVYIANFRDSLEATSVNAIEDDEAELIEEEAEGQGDALARRHSNKNPKKSTPVIRTVISFDKGGAWGYLKPPATDSLGKTVTCEDAQRCFLHLHGITHFDRFAPFYSIENALGLVLGTGNVGTHLSRNPSEINTYISRDAGLTWKEAHKGAFIYEYGDHGGLVVMADDNAPTDQVVFSWNEGHSWYDFKLGMSNIQVDNVIIEPSSGGMEFLLYGLVNERGVMFHLDFAALQMPMCMGSERPNAMSSDYETWIPSDGTSRECLLGKKMKYVRKRVTSECFNGKAFERSKGKDFCDCTEKDYICEIGFYRTVGTDNGIGECLPSPYADREYMDVHGCTSSGTYMTAAYRKVPGDECIRGFAPSLVSVPCPPSSPMPHNARFTLALLLFFGIGLAFINWASRHPILRKYFANTGFDTFMEVGYQVVGKATERVQKGGEEIFNFWNPSIQTTDTANPPFGIITIGKSAGQGDAAPSSGMQEEVLAATQMTAAPPPIPFYEEEEDCTPVQSRPCAPQEMEEYAMPGFTQSHQTTLNPPTKSTPAWDSLI